MWGSLQFAQLLHWISGPLSVMSVWHNFFFSACFSYVANACAILYQSLHKHQIQISDHHHCFTAFNLSEYICQILLHRSEMASCSMAESCMCRELVINEVEQVILLRLIIQNPGRISTDKSRLG